MTDPDARPDLRPPIPITVFGGFLGAGKTTLINGLIGGEVIDRRLAVVVNDFGAIDIDGRLIAAVHDDVVTLTNGCICCSIRDGVATTVLKLAERPTPPEHVIVEASGVSEPGALAEVFLELQRAGFVRVDGLVTAVDTDAFAPDDPEIGRLTRAQVSQADLLVMTKLDIATAERAETVSARIRSLNPHARILAASALVPTVLLGLRDEEGPRDSEGDTAQPPETLAHPPHLKTGHVRVDAPVAYRPLFDALKALPAAVYRAKGWLNLLERPGDKIVVHVVGRRIHVRTIGRWQDGETARTELVFIGAEKGWDPEDVERAVSATVAE